MTTRFEDIPALLEGLARLPAERPALTFYKGKTRAGQWTYGELLGAVDRFARRLRDQLGVRQGDRVAVLSPNRLEVPALFLAAMQLGAAVVPLNPTTPPADWDYILAHSEARLVFGARDLLDRLVTRPAVVCAFEDETVPGGNSAGGGGASPPPGVAAPADAKSLAKQMAIVLYTSGTTGNPKGVALGQGSLLANAWSMALNFRFEDETQLAVLPLYHAHALGFGLMTTLTTGGHLVFMERFDPFAWGEVLRVEAVTLTSVVPTLLQPLLQIGVRAEKMPTLRAILVSSAPLTSSLARAFEEKTNLRLLQGWGLSEYTNFACCLPADLAEEERRRLLYGGELTCIGSPLPGTEVKIVDAEGATLPADQRGELCVRGHSTMLSYFRDEGATVATLGADGWLRTGDEGFFQQATGPQASAGRPAFFITGRIKETIIRDGDKFSPLAIERRIVTEIPEIEGRLVALGFPHDLHGEEIGLYLENEELGDELRARRTKVAGEMPLDARPKVILYGATPIPRTHTGKIQRRK
ncbi:MAG TPA: class I adenylate-forming enzyme family protein, partial [Polyangia bacterium]|nr:class I adenylate-forming enzyme family protein [Polyangia bacterium]